MTVTKKDLKNLENNLKRDLRKDLRKDIKEEVQKSKNSLLEAMRENNKQIYQHVDKKVDSGVLSLKVLIEANSHKMDLVIEGLQPTKKQTENNKKEIKKLRNRVQILEDVYPIIRK
jgi:hypothetical protein